MFPALSPEATTNNGLWSDDDTYEWVCDANGNDGEKYFGHYMYLVDDEFVHGKLSGRCVDGVCMGEWVENGFKGTDLFDRTADGKSHFRTSALYTQNTPIFQLNLIHFTDLLRVGDRTSSWWTYPIPDDVTDEINDEDNHNVEGYEYRTTTDNQQCNSGAAIAASSMLLVMGLVAAFF